MPRLLLVDDNPSIHRIAESLLAPTDVELICVDSAAEALDRLERGERFDVALVDTAMPGMDGWTLLGRLRAMEETARMPIALMAGVLDPVDPSKLAKAPIQGFLKKPIELRELGDRVKALLATPVPVGPSPFSTVPATPARDLVKRAEEALPELRPEPVVPPSAPEATGLAEFEGDLLVLTAEDLWPEDADPLQLEPVLTVPAPADVHLELEELDLDSLQDLTSETLPPAAPSFEEPAVAPPSFDAESVFADEDEALVTLPGLDELEALPTDFRMLPPEPEPEPEFEPAPVPVPAAEAADMDEAFAHLPEAAALIGGVGLAATAGMALAEAPAPEAAAAPTDLEPAPAPALEVEVPAAGGQAPAAPGQAPAAPVSSEQAQALVQALLADPVLVDALVKAVVARMGDQVLREIAWEVMPDLAGRLHQ